MDTMKDNVCREEKGKDSRKDEKENSEKKPGMLGKAVTKIAVPLVAGIMAVGGAACSSTVKSVYPTCDCCDADSESTDMENENDVNSDMDEEDSELDTPADVPEIEDVPVEDADEDVTGDTVEEDATADAEEDTAFDVGEDVVEDTSADVSEEDVVGETVDAIDEDVVGDAPMDVAEEDVLVDPSEEDADSEVGGDVSFDLVDEDISVDPGSEDVISDASCSAIDASGLLILLTGDSGTVGNITIRYNGCSSYRVGNYDILCGSSVVRSGINIAEGSTDTIYVTEHGFQVRLRVDSARDHATTTYVTIDG